MFFMLKNNKLRYTMKILRASGNYNNVQYYLEILCDLLEFGVVSFSLASSWFRLQVYKLGTKALPISISFSFIIGFLAAVTTIALGEVP